MNVVDSSGWLAYFAGTKNAAAFAPAIEDTSRLLVPTVSLFEVFKRVLQQRGEADALSVTAQMQQGTVVNLDAPLALDAARLSVQEALPLADSIMLATARAHQATLWSQDTDFKSVPGVRFFAP